MISDGREKKNSSIHFMRAAISQPPSKAVRIR